MKIPSINKDLFKKLPRNRRSIVTLIVIVVVVIGAVLLFSGSPEAEIEEVEAAPQAVVAKSFQEITSGTSLEKTALIKRASSAPLIARSGGRVTALNAKLGDTVGAGTVIAEIDGDTVGNPIEAQISGASSSIAAFGAVERAGIAAAQTAVEIAEINEAAARANKPLTNEQAQLARDLADNSVTSTTLALEDARDTGNDDVIRSTDLANKAAGLAQDQATVGKQLAAQQGSDAVKLAQENLEATQQAYRRTVAEFSSQRVQLITQLKVATEQHKLQQVATPVNGEIVRLTVRPGDFVNPGQQIGEVAALEGAEVTIDVTPTIAAQLVVGQELPISTARQEFTGEIARVASGAAAATGLTQVDIFIVSTPDVIQPLETVTVHIPNSRVTSNTTFIPLDALTVRQSGTVLFSVDKDGIVSEHQIEVLGYSGDFVETRIELSSNALVVVEGNRTLRSGDLVAVK